MCPYSVQLVGSWLSAPAWSSGWSSRHQRAYLVAGLWTNNKQLAHALASTVCALTARRILIEKVRQYLAQSAGGRYVHTSVHDSMQVVNPTQEILLEIDQAMERLRKYDESKYLVASLRIYLGFSREEIAQALNTNLSKVKRDWKFASAWLAREVSRR